MEDILADFLTRLEKEETIIKAQTDKENAHLTFKDGRMHTLMRMRAWANIQVEKAQQDRER